MSRPEEFPEQDQPRHPGRETQMQPRPEIIREDYRGSEKLKGKKVLITGGDSGIGRAVAVHCARQGADIGIVYLEEDEDARQTRQMVEKENRQCLILKGDLREESFQREAIESFLEKYDRLHVLVNNAAVQYPKDEFEELKAGDLRKTFETNIISMILMTQKALPHLREGDRIINTTSVTAYRGSSHLLDYSSTKGGITAFTRSLAKNLASKGILVNGVAPGPIWTPLIPSSFEKVAEFGSDTPLGRAGQPSEVAPAYVFLASEDSSYITGQIIHINGGEVVGG